MLTQEWFLFLYNDKTKKIINQEISSPLVETSGRWLTTKRENLSAIDLGCYLMALLACGSMEIGVGLFIPKGLT